MARISVHSGRINEEETRNQILHQLRAASGIHVSGQELSRRLGVTRAAIWKQIAQLRGDGYVIEAVPARGYCLISGPELLTSGQLRRELNSALVGCDIHSYSTISSTNVHAIQLAENGAAEGTVVIADAQSAGKGRLGRTWSSPPGVNLYLSLILRPPVPPRAAPLMTFLSSLAVARTIEAECRLTPTVKWPNDVLLDGCKVAGLLNEMSAESERVHYLVLGIGLNVNMKSEDFPDQLRYPATSLCLAAGRTFDRLALCRRLLEELDQLYHIYLTVGSEPIRSGWLHYFNLCGIEVEVDEGRRRITGIVTGIDDDGALLLRRGDGAAERVLAGDVRPVAP